MSTSCNVVLYDIKDQTGKTVGTHRQHYMCKTNNTFLLQFTPPENYTLYPYGYDAEEELWEGTPIALDKFLNQPG